MDCCATLVEKGAGAEIVESATVSGVTAKIPEPVVIETPKEAPPVEASQIEVQIAPTAADVPTNEPANVPAAEAPAAPVSPRPMTKQETMKDDATVVHIDMLYLIDKADP